MFVAFAPPMFDIFKEDSGRPPVLRLGFHRRPGARDTWVSLLEGPEKEDRQESGIGAVVLDGPEVYRERHTENNPIRVT